MSAELKPGYKQTEVGVIPEDWGIQTLEDSCELVTKGTTPTSIGRDFTKSGINFLKAESISDCGKTIPNKVAFIDGATHAVLKRSQLILGDVLVSIAGVLGRVGLVEKTDLPANINQALAIVRLGKHSVVKQAFLFYCLRSPVIGRQIRDINVQAAQANISLQNVRNFRLPLPPTKAEQEVIAEALSDADALIESLEQLIAKKRHLKQGAMQELLTGKKRLPGFSGEWELKPLDAVAQIRSGGTPSTNRPEFWDGDVLWCTPTDITALNGFKYLTHTARQISLQGLTSSSAELIPAHSVVMTSRATIGECAINAVPVATNQGFKNFIPYQATDCEFLYYLLQTKKHDFMNLCGGSTFLEIGKAQLVGFEIELPSEYEEQAAIAAILSDMDAEIAALEAKLAKARQIKQGMMQELLTGRIRLV